MSNIVYASDTVFSSPASNEWNPNQTTPQQLVGGRLMSDGFHQDGMAFVPAGLLTVNSANLVLTRNGTGDWSLNRTAAGAETYYARINCGAFAGARTGEQYFLDSFPNFSNFTESPKAPPKGFQIDDIFAVMNVGVVALTAATLRLSTVQYALETAAAAAPVVTDIVPATALGNLGTNAAGAYLTQNIAIASASQIISSNDLAQTELELAFTMANTGTVRIVGLGFHYNFNYN